MPELTVLLFCLVSLAVLGIGCTKGFVSHTRLTPTGLAPEDAIAVIQVGDAVQEYSDKLEKKVVECIKDSLADTHPTVRIVPPEEFREVAFPDLTPEQVRLDLVEGSLRWARDVDSDAWGTIRDRALADRQQDLWLWDQLTRDPSLETRIAPLDVRYLIIVSGGTTTDLGFAAYGAQYGGVWELIFDNQTILEARIIDLKQGREAGIVNASASGKTEWLWPPAPIIIPTFPEARACSELGEQVAGFLEETLPAATEETLPAATEELGTSIGKAEEDDCWPPCLCSDQSC